MRLATQRDIGVLTRRLGLYGLAAVIGLSLRATSAYAFSGTEGASFLDIPVGAGPAAMGSAYTAQAEDAYAPIWNPAGLGFLPSTQVAAQHLSYLDSLNYEFLSFTHPFVEKGGFGAAVQYLGTGNIDRTDSNATSLGSYSAYYSAFTASYGMNVTKEISIGASTKWIHSKISDVTANAFAADFGTIYHTTDKLSLAATLTNVGTHLKFVNQSDPLPLGLHIGANYWANSHWNTNAEMVYEKQGLLSFRTGVEWNPIDLFSLRAGYRTETTRQLSALAGFSTGFGLHLWHQEFAYAWLPMGDLGNTQYFSLILRFWDLAIPHPRRNLIYYRPEERQNLSMNNVRGSVRQQEPDSSMLMDYDEPSTTHVVMKAVDTKGAQ